MTVEIPLTNLPLTDFQIHPCFPSLCDWYPWYSECWKQVGHSLTWLNISVSLLFSVCFSRVIFVLPEGSSSNSQHIFSNSKLQPSCSWEHGQHLNTTHKGHLKYEVRDFSRGPPANAGDTGSVPALGSSHMTWGNWAHASPVLKPMHPRACAPRRKKSLQWEAHTLQLESSPHSHNWRKPTQ